MYKLIYTLFLGILFSACCNKAPELAVGVKLNYPDLISNNYKIKAAIWSSNFSAFIDSVSFGELHSLNNYSAFIDFQEDARNYIIFVEGSTYLDTISDIHFEIEGRCKQKIENFHYKHNGHIKTEKVLVIR